jgi:hypothetical protein
MPRTPNYSMERKDRDRAKAAKKAEKLAAKAAAKERAAAGKQDDTEAAPETGGQGDR